MMQKFSARRPCLVLAVPMLPVLATLLAGCSPDLASFDDTYVPASVEENFPITVVERPVRVTLDATPGGLAPGDANLVLQLARRMTTGSSTPVTVSYASGSKSSRQAADQAAAILARQGVPRYAIVVSPRDGRDNNIVLAFSTKVAETKPCGDWSRNMRANQFNDSGPNFGCSVQQNMAAITANPEDLQQPRAMSSALSASQSAAFDAYYKGAWVQPSPSSVPIFSVGQ